MVAIRLVPLPDVELVHHLHRRQVPILLDVQHAGEGRVQMGSDEVTKSSGLIFSTLLFHSLLSHLLSKSPGLMSGELAREIRFNSLIFEFAMQHSAARSGKRNTAVQMSK